MPSRRRRSRWATEHSPGSRSCRVTRPWWCFQTAWSPPRAGLWAFWWIAPGIGSPELVEGGLQRCEVALAGVGGSGDGVDVHALRAHHPALEGPGGRPAQLEVRGVAVRQLECCDVHDPVVLDRDPDPDVAVVGVRGAAGGAAGSV